MISFFGSTFCNRRFSMCKKSLSSPIITTCNQLNDAKVSHTPICIIDARKISDAKWHKMWKMLLEIIQQKRIVFVVNSQLSAHLRPEQLDDLAALRGCDYLRMKSVYLNSVDDCNFFAKSAPRKLRHSPTDVAVYCVEEPQQWARGFFHSLSKNEALTSLTLKNCGIGEKDWLPVSGLTQLRELTVSSVPFDSDIVKSFSEALSTLSLSTLTLTECHFGTLPSSRSVAGMPVPCRSAECIESFCSAISSMKSLRTIQLSGNDLSSEAIGFIFVALRENNNLERLLFNINTIGDVSSLVLAESFSHWPKLKWLEAADTALSSTGFDTISSKLPHLSNLEALDFSYNHAGDEGIAALSKGLTRMAQLRSVKLIECEFSAIGARALAHAFNKIPSITELDIGRNEIGTAGVKSIATRLWRLPSLTALGLTMTDLRLQGASILGPHLPILTSLRRLNIDRNPLLDDGVLALSRGIKLLHNLTYLNMSDCGFKENGANALAEALTDLRCVKKIDISLNHCGDRGAEALFSSLSASKSTLKSLNLSSCNIGPRGIRALAASADRQNLASLKNLSLGWNHLGDVGAKRLCRILPKLTALETLLICDCEIGHEGALILADVLVDSSLIGVNVDGNNFGEEARGELEFAIRNGDIVMYENTPEWTI